MQLSETDCPCSAIPVSGGADGERQARLIGVDPLVCRRVTRGLSVDILTPIKVPPIKMSTISVPSIRAHVAIRCDHPSIGYAAVNRGV